VLWLLVNNNKNSILHLSLIPQVGPATVAKLVERIGIDNMHTIYAYRFEDFVRMGLSPHAARLVCDGLASKKIVDDELQLCEKHAIKWTTVYAVDYPVLLRHITLPPSVLYWRGGSFEHYPKMVAVVGSRSANNYGESVIQQVVPELVKSGWTIVSGGALGADSMAHKAAIAAGGTTVAIIGAGLLRPYPLSHKSLFEKIIETGGMYVSPFPLTMSALPGNFPARNRIISGMCKGVVVVQAAYESGTRTTALYALEQGREVCAVPGRIDDPLSSGCHRLINEGATLITQASDVLSTLGDSNVQRYATKVVQDCVQQKIPCDDPIVRACQQSISFDELLQFVPNHADLHERLCALQFEGVIEQDFMGRWRVASR
jgi:DNA processing protein